MLRSSLAVSDVFAHSNPGGPIETWEPLSRHLGCVGDRAAEFAAVFGWAAMARVAGRLHDIGKCSRAFQAYIGQPMDPVSGARGPDHSTAGAREAFKAYPKSIGRLLAFAIAGHHAGLADAEGLDRRLGDDYPIESYDGWETHSGPLAATSTLVPTRTGDVGPESGFREAFICRMLFSCLVDADFLETERFYSKVNGEIIERGGHRDLRELRNRLRRHMAMVREEADPTPVNTLRAEVLEHAVAHAGLSPGLFTLTVPTGGGKTLASLSFALEHAVKHGLRRVVYVIPFTSVIEQTAAVFRKALDSQTDILEHHASFDWERQSTVRTADDEGPDGLRKLRRAAENWDAPIVVTTAVQFFESLYAARTSRCRKLHNLAGSVIILDEAQTLPIHLLRPCVAALDELARNYNATVVLCTATQPALREMDGFTRGFKIDDDRELAPDPPALYERLRRVRVEKRPGPVTDEMITARFHEQAQMLCIVNSRAHARTLFAMIQNLPGATHLTTLMCPRHRRAVLETVRERLKGGEPMRLVATSLIEAGVDVDFPEVWRAAAGLDSIAQAAGRCNREGRVSSGRTVVFEAADGGKAPREVEALWQAGREVLRRHADPLSLDAVHEYFSLVYWQKGEKALDASRLDGEVWPILEDISERAKDFTFRFDSIARAFRMIDTPMEPVVVPWDDEAQGVLAKIARADRPYASDLRRLQQFVVAIPRRVRETWLTEGILSPVHPNLGASILKLEDLNRYRPETGLEIGELYYRSAESNVIS